MQPVFVLSLLRAARGTIGLAALLAAVGCQTMQTPRVQVLEPLPARPTVSPAAAAMPAPPQRTAGAIYAVGAHRPLFEDRRARFVGDVLTVQIQEKTSARQKSDTAINRDGKLEASVGALPLFSLNSFARAKASGASSNSVNGKGETGSDNTFVGTITVTVVEVLPNGNLLVTGEKQVGINQNVDVMRFSGVVNPVSVLPNNVVSSTQIADARLEYRGRGDIDRAQTTGWLSRFFLSWLPI